METIRKYYGIDILVTIAALVTGFYVGGWEALYVVAFLGVLETSLSLDNAVVNAKKLETMTPFWRQMFLTIGMLIAVFGMRIVFPVAIVSVTTSIGMWDVWQMALHDPKKYSEALVATHTMIAGYGGAFLMMVALKFFMDDDKDSHFLAWIEKPLAIVGKAESIQIVFTLIALYVTSKFIPTEGAAFLLAGATGIITYVLVDSLELITGGGEDEGPSTAVQMVKGGIGAFIYLEVLDASFSFDGVIGAFAITTDVIIIALGLGIGAMFVRSSTLLLVDKGTLAEYKFLEHGAFYAIASLAGIMFVSTFMHISEAVSGTIGAACIGVSLLASVIHKHYHPEVEDDNTGALLILEGDEPKGLLATMANDIATR